MGKYKNVLIIAALVVGIAITFAIKNRASNPKQTEKYDVTAVVPAVSNPNEQINQPSSEVAQTRSIPKMIDLGADKCIPCKKMAPILEELKKTYIGKLDIEFIDVWKNPDRGKNYNLRMIPTQIFYSPDGKELFRHEGFFSREDILAKWKELGFDVDKGVS